MANAVRETKSLPTNRHASQGDKANPYAGIDEPSTNRDWSLIDVNAGDIQLLVAACVAAGDAVMFSASKKGPIIGITVYHNGEPIKAWPKSPDECSEIIGKITRSALSQLPNEVVEKLTC